MSRHGVGRCSGGAPSSGGGPRDVCGFAIEQCGWLKDRYGVSWQISPTRLGDMMKDPDRARARRVMEAMLGLKKLDLAGLERAYRG